MKQYEAVLLTLERLGGQATLAQLYKEVMRVEGVQWGTKTPFASIRRIVQDRPEIYRVRPGLWALESRRAEIGVASANPVRESRELQEESHSYYQGLITMIGNLRGFATFVPNQDQNKLCLRRRLGDLRTMDQIPDFTYDPLARRAGTVDVSWFNDRGMPHSLFEVEHSTDISHSLLKFFELQDFNTRMVIVASSARRREYNVKKRHVAFRAIAERTGFYDYETLARDYEYAAATTSADFIL